MLQYRPNFFSKPQSKFEDIFGISLGIEYKYSEFVKCRSIDSIFYSVFYCKIRKNKLK